MAAGTEVQGQVKRKVQGFWKHPLTHLAEHNTGISLTLGVTQRMHKGRLFDRLRIRVQNSCDECPQQIAQIASLPQSRHSNLLSKSAPNDTSNDIFALLVTEP